MNNKIKFDIGWVIFTFFLLLYLLFPNNNQNFDSYSYSISIRNGTDFFHPHHLIYNLFGFVLFNIFSFTGLGSMKIMSLANTFLAVFTLLLIYRIIRYRTDGFLAALGTITIGSFYTFWYCATSVEVNMPAIFFLFAAFYFLIVKENYPVSPWLVYLFLMIGMLFHQHMALAGIPVFIYYIFKYKSLWNALKPAHPGILGGALIYLVVAIQQSSEKTIKGIYEWITSYAHMGVWGKFQMSAFRDAIWGKLKLFFGGEKIREVFYAGYHDHATVIYFVIIAIILLGIIYLVIKSLYFWIKHHDRINSLLAALFIIYALFTFWWAPAIDDFWLYPALIFMLFLFISIIPGRADRIIMIIVAVLLLSVNTVCEFIPSSKKANSYIYQGVEAFKRLHLTSDDLVITNYSQIRLAYEYYTGIHVPTACLMYLPMGPKDSVLSAYHGQIARAEDTASVIIFDDELMPEKYRAYLFERFSPADYDSTYARYFNRLAPVDSIDVHGRKVKLFELLKSPAGQDSLINSSQEQSSAF